MPKPPPRHTRSSTLRITIASRGVVVDATLEDSTDRSVRFAMARFGPAVHVVHVVYSQPPADTLMCTIRVGFSSPASSLIVRQHAKSLEDALRGALQQAAAEIARELDARSKGRFSRRD